MNKYIVTAIYDGLHGTELGGRVSRGDHYRHSLESIMGIDSAKYIIYHNDPSLHPFFEMRCPNIKYDLISGYDLNKTIYSDKINKNKNIQDTLTSFRCIELQYSKLFWLKEQAEKCNEEDYIFWFDAGLSYSGLIPNKYLKLNEGYYGTNFYSTLFNNKLFDNMIESCKDKVFVIGKENFNFFWDHDLPDKYYDFGKDRSYHIIGGIFGGKTKSVINLYEKFDTMANVLLDNESVLYSEENILTAIYFNNKDMFHMHDFDIWWHEDNIASNIGEEAGKELLTRAKSFYKILENLL